MAEESTAFVTVLQKHTVVECCWRCYSKKDVLIWQFGCCGYNWKCCCVHLDSDWLQFNCLSTVQPSLHNRAPHWRAAERLIILDAFTGSHSKIWKRFLQTVWNHCGVKVTTGLHRFNSYHSSGISSSFLRKYVNRFYTTNMEERACICLSSPLTQQHIYTSWMTAAVIISIIPLFQACYSEGPVTAL